jgi:hypothetical protein
MKIKLQKIIYLTILGLILSASLQTPASNNASSTVSAIPEERMIEPSDLFKDFPGIKLGMSFEDAKKAIERKDIQPTGFKNEKTELVWDDNYNGIMGSGQLRFKNDEVHEITVVIYAMNKRNAIFKTFQQKITARHGVSKAVEDTPELTSNVWRLKDGVAIGLQVNKEANYPTIYIHWVKE